MKLRGKTRPGRQRPIRRFRYNGEIQTVFSERHHNTKSTCKFSNAFPMQPPSDSFTGMDRIPSQPETQQAQRRFLLGPVSDRATHRFDGDGSLR